MIRLVFFLLLAIPAAGREASPVAVEVQQSFRRKFLEAHDKNVKLREAESFLLSSAEKQHFGLSVKILEKWSVSASQDSDGDRTDLSSFAVAWDAGPVYLEAGYRKMRGMAVDQLTGANFEEFEFRPEIELENAKVIAAYILWPERFSLGEAYERLRPLSVTSGSPLFGIQLDSVYARGGGPLFSAIPADSLGADQDLDKAHFRVVSVYAGYGWSGLFWERLRLHFVLNLGGSVSFGRYSLAGEKRDHANFGKFIHGVAALDYNFGPVYLGAYVESGSPHMETESILFQLNDHMIRGYLGYRF